MESSLDVIIPVVVERLDVERVFHQTGTVRIRKIVHEEPAIADAADVQEVVETFRIPINQVVDVALEPHYQGDTLVVPVYEEQWVRRLVLTEEVHVVKRRTTLARQENALLRREEVVIERLDPTTQKWVLDSAF